ncbi:Sec7 domain-containing protein [Choanephora cucurbitarum]|nr:Sec7 domain-containing protein [Choanephora cucurbitarum]
MALNLPKRSHSLAYRNQIGESNRHGRSSSLTDTTKSRSNQIARDKDQSMSSAPVVYQEPDSYLSSKSIIPPTRSSSLTQSSTDEEVRQSMLDWKHKSVFRIDNLFSPVSLWEKQELIFGTVESLLLTEYQQQAENKASSLWEERCNPKEEIASYLGRRDPFCHKVLVCYLRRFDFTGLNLVEAFRKLCSKLYFKAEAQEIDRILEAFSLQYWNTHQDDLLYKCADVVYTVAYSIMLLNTDLHLVQINHHKKMSCQTFCSNTLATLMEQNIPFEKNDILNTIWKYDMIERLKIKESYILVREIRQNPSSKKSVPYEKERRKLNNSSTKWDFALPNFTFEQSIYKKKIILLFVCL